MAVCVSASPRSQEYARDIKRIWIKKEGQRVVVHSSHWCSHEYQLWLLIGKNRLWWPSRAKSENKETGVGGKS